MLISMDTSMTGDPLEVKNGTAGKLVDVKPDILKGSWS